MTINTSTRARWAAIGAAVAVSIGAGSIGVVDAIKSSGELPIFTAIEPCRLLDTRPAQAVGGRNTPLTAGETVPVTATGNSGQCSGIPADVGAVALNVTAVGASELTHLTFWAGGARPNASSLNPAPGQPPTPNAVTVELTPGGTFNVFNFAGNVHLIIDLVGIHQDHTHEALLSQHIPVSAIFIDSGAPVTWIGNAQGLPVGVGDALAFDFSVPDAAPGAVDANVRLRIGTAPSGCTVRFVVQNVNVHRAGTQPAPATATAPGPISLTGPGFALHDYTVGVSSLAPGDVVYVRAQRQTTGANDCGGPLSLAAVTVDFDAS